MGSPSMNSKIIANNSSTGFSHPRVRDVPSADWRWIVYRTKPEPVKDNWRPRQADLFNGDGRKESARDDDHDEGGTGSDVPGERRRPHDRGGPVADDRGVGGGGRGGAGQAAGDAGGDGQAGGL